LVRRQVSGGGSLGLVDLIDRYGEALRWDLRFYLGIDLLDFFRGQLDARAVLAYITYLPDDSALHAHLMAEPRRPGAGRPEPWRQWYGYGRLLSVLYDQWDLAAAAATGKGKPPKHPGRPGQPQGVSLSKLIPRRRPTPTPPIPTT